MIADATSAAATLLIYLLQLIKRKQVFMKFL